MGKWVIPKYPIYNNESPDRDSESRMIDTNTL